MKNLSECILNEENFYKKVELIEFISKKVPIVFDKTVVFKAMIAKLFIETMKLDVNKNLVITACLLYSCKKMHDAQNLDKVKSYARRECRIFKKTWIFRKIL